MATGSKLVIVESPTKAKKIGGYLGSGYTVMASVGHIRDLARDGGAALGVLHLDGAAALFIHPVQIGSGVGRLGRDLEEVAAGHIGKGLGKLRGLAAGGKIGN